MKVFISWSGKGSLSHRAAELLREWIPMVVQSAVPWISSEISAGQIWNNEVNRQLASTEIGILCVTRENFAAPWLIFEAGALAKGMEQTRVIPLLIDLKQSDITNSPLTSFQSKTLDRAGLFELLRDINELCGQKLPAEALQAVFDALWPRFETGWARIKKELAAPKEAPPRREAADILEEVLSLTRDMYSKLSGRIDQLEFVAEGKSAWEVMNNEIGFLTAKKRHELSPEDRETVLSAFREWEKEQGEAPAE